MIRAAGASVCLAVRVRFLALRRSAMFIARRTIHRFSGERAILVIALSPEITITWLYFYKHFAPNGASAERRGRLKSQLVISNWCPDRQRSFAHSLTPLRPPLIMLVSAQAGIVV